MGVAGGAVVVGGTEVDEPGHGDERSVSGGPVGWAV